MDNQMQEPWKLDTNNKYSEVIKSIFGLATASLLLPIFMARNFLDVDSSKALLTVFSCSIYIAWISFGLTIFSCVFYQYLSAKWIRLAWGKEAGILFSKNTKEYIVECWMEICFWFSVLFYVFGIVLTIYYFASYQEAL